MSLSTVSQLYVDVEQLVKQGSQQFAESAILSLFNANLAEAKKTQLDNPILQAVPEAVGQVRLGDLFVRVGQLRNSMNDGDRGR